MADINWNQLSEKHDARVLRGCYILWDKCRAVYVGQSNNILGRVGNHVQKQKKAFDSFSYVEIGNEYDLTEAEVCLIVDYKPTLNTILPVNNRYVALYELSVLENWGDVNCFMIENQITPVWKEYYDILEFKNCPMKLNSWQKVDGTKIKRITDLHMNKEIA